MRHTISNLEESKIREVANAGIGRSDVLAFWFGESDEVTPDFIRQAAIDSFNEGETFTPTTWGCRAAPRRLRWRCRATPCARSQNAGSTTSAGSTPPIGMERIAVTAGGVNALMLAGAGAGRRGR